MFIARLSLIIARAPVLYPISVSLLPRTNRLTDSYASIPALPQFHSYIDQELNLLLPLPRIVVLQPSQPSFSSVNKVRLMFYLYRAEHNQYTVGHFFYF